MSNEKVSEVVEELRTEIKEMRKISHSTMRFETVEAWLEKIEKANKTNG